LAGEAEGESIVKKLLLTAAAGLAVIAAPIAASAQPYGGYGHGYHGQSNGYRGQSNGYRGQNYGDNRGWNGRDRGDNGGALLAAGVFGLVLGAIASNAANSQSAGYYDQSNYYPTCSWENQAYRNAWGQLEYQQVQVCR
jgi:hypothetical protein